MKSMESVATFAEWIFDLTRLRTPLGEYFSPEEDHTEPNENILKRYLHKQTITLPKDGLMPLISYAGSVPKIQKNHITLLRNSVLYLRYDDLSREQGRLGKTIKVEVHFRMEDAHWQQACAIAQVHHSKKTIKEVSEKEYLIYLPFLALREIGYSASEALMILQYGDLHYKAIEEVSHWKKSEGRQVEKRYHKPESDYQRLVNLLLTIPVNPDLSRISWKRSKDLLRKKS